MNLDLLSTKPQKICSIDASTNSMAWAIFDGEELIDYGKVDFVGTNTYSKVIDAGKKAADFFSQNKLDAIVIEHTVFMNSPKTAADLALVQGALLGASQIKLIRSVAPITWQNFIGNKKISKEEKLEIKKQNPDKSDSWIKNYERNLRKERTIHYIDVQYDRLLSDNDIADAIAIGHYAVRNWERLTK